MIRFMPVYSGCRADGYERFVFAVKLMGVSYGIKDKRVTVLSVKYQVCCDETR